MENHPVSIPNRFVLIIIINAFTSDEQLAVCLARLFLCAILLNLFRILVLIDSISPVHRKAKSKP